MLKNFLINKALLANLRLGLFAIAVSSATNAETIHYISSSIGNDQNDGLSEETPWSSLKKISNQTFEPGDVIKLKSGDTFFGTLDIKSSGQPGKPIVFTKYGGEALPIIDASSQDNGEHVAAIMIQDQDQIEISHLNIRNHRKHGQSQSSTNEKSIQQSTNSVSYTHLRAHET